MPFSVDDALAEVEPIDEVVTWTEGAPGELPGTETRLHITIAAVDGGVEEVSAKNNNAKFDENSKYLCSDHFRAQVITTWQTEDGQLDETLGMSGDFFISDGKPGPIRFSGVNVDSATLKGALPLQGPSGEVHFSLDREFQPRLMGRLTTSITKEVGTGVSAGQVNILLQWGNTP